MRPIRPDDPELLDFLRAADLTLPVASARIRIWVERDESGQIVGSTGFETADDPTHALIRSVAVLTSSRGQGNGLRLATFALNAARAAGSRRAWLFSRRSGPFWQRLGFAPADRAETAELLASTQQVSLFRESRQLEREVAWARDL